MLEVTKTKAKIAASDLEKQAFLVEEKTLTFFSVRLLIFTEKRSQNLYERREVEETGNVLLPSTHLSIHMSTPLRERPHVNMKSSGHDPLEMKEPDSMGNQLLLSGTTAGFAKRHLL